MNRKEVLTTGEVARICHVAPRTVSKWFDTGQLKGYRIPGSRDRRIPLGQLVRFMRAHGMPMEGMDGSTLRVLVVDDEQGVLETIRDMLATSAKYEVRLACNGFEAGMVAEQFHPHVILLDLMLGDVDGQTVCRSIKQNPALSATRVVAVSGQLPPLSGQAGGLEGFDAFMAKPFSLSDLINTVEQASNLLA